jgi:hypothetical protein
MINPKMRGKSGSRKFRAMFAGTIKESAGSRTTPAIMNTIPENM